MAYYVKARKRAIAQLGIEGYRNYTPDGHVLLWQSDLRLAAAGELHAAAAAIGGALLTPAEAREEMDGLRTTPVPVPTDERYLLAEDLDEASHDEEAAEEEPATEPQEGAEP